VIRGILELAPCRPEKEMTDIPDEKAAEALTEVSENHY
jgi:hypothetical protein